MLRAPAAGLNKSDPRAANVCTIAQELVMLLNKAISCAPFMLESSDVKFTMEVTDRVMDSYVQVSSPAVGRSCLFRRSRNKNVGMLF